MTTPKVPIAMVFVRAKDGISHSPKGWSDKEDCAEGALVLGKVVLNFDELLKQKSV
jgi:N-carbamoyl-L-amino-acid hydrolase